MHRSVILDFLAMNRIQLNKYNFKQATISLLGRFNQKEITSLVLRPDEVVTYHVNEPRIYEKTYSFDVFSETICDMIVFTKQMIYLKKEELTSIKDPYYLKDIRLLDFYSCMLVPIIKKEDVVGTIIFYFDDDAKGFKPKNSDLNKLYESLQDVSSSLYENEIYSKINENEDYIKIIFLKNDNKCFIDNQIKNRFHLKSNLVDLNNKVLKNKIFKEISSKKYRHVKSCTFDIYYISKFDYAIKAESLDVLSIVGLNESITDKFSLIFIDKLNIDNDLITEFSDFLIKKYHVNDDLYLYLLNDELPSKTIQELKNKYASTYFLVITSKNITNKMNLTNIINFVSELRVETFSLNDYIKYVNSLNYIELYSDVESSKTIDKKFVNSVTKEEYCILPKLARFNLQTKLMVKQYEEAIYKFINSLIKNNDFNYLIPIVPSMLTNKKIFIALQKLISFGNNPKVLLTIPSIDVVNILDLEKGLSKLKKMGVLVTVDSSVYFNNKTLYLLDLCDSIYLHSDEYESLVNYPSGINTAIIQYMIKNYKEIIIEYPFEKVTDAYFNSLLYYLK